ncbi:peptidase M20 [Pullulanibacillus camelliae]|uniref:Peptidase M20 n=1 Tax=Pullulanibacillus camelliae TaxID=1707096 RepID=A0A8J2YNG9_9BACL|nr:M20/M25/M40 family metallo-hydrolase [Pullulanibacillus camelliae]GGE55809.1 peptidase M20 [Pullulanibacillus camelliae]
MEEQLRTDFVEQLEQLKRLKQVQLGLHFLEKDHEATVEEQITITEIPSPPFKEGKRAAYLKNRFSELGLKDVAIDEVGNVMGWRRGNGAGPTLVVSAHLDTVFPEGTDTVVTKKGNVLYAPGIGDDGRGLTALLTLIRALDQAGVKTVGDLLFVGTVGEEGLGNLRGVKALFKNNENIDGFISVEQGDETIYAAVGSLRYHVTYKGPGGHSFGTFGVPSATHALGRAIALIADVRPPSDPKTTFNVGTVEGGTSINAIAEQASLTLDLRSSSPEALQKLNEEILALIRRAARDENERWESDQLKVEMTQVGDRPTGIQGKDAPIVQVALASSHVLGHEPRLEGASSTDANVPISLGIPALTLGGGGVIRGMHTLEENFDPTGAYDQVQRIFLTMLALVGIEEEQEPLLKK